MNDKQGRSSFFFLLRFIWPYSHLVLLTFLALCLAAGTVLFLGQGLRTLVDQGFANSNPALLNQALISLLALVALLSLASFSRSYLSSWLGEKISTDIKTKLFKHLLSLPPEFYQKNSLGNLQSQLHSDSMLIQVLLGGSASTGLRSIIQFFGAMCLLFVSNPKLAGLACFMMPLTLLPLVIFGRQVRQTARHAQEAEGQASGYSNESISSIQTIQAYGRQQESLEKFKALTQESLRLARKRIFAQSCLSTAVIFLVFAAVSGLMWYGGHEVLAKNITSGDLISFVFYAVLAAGSINSLSQVYGDWQRALAACERLADLLHIKSSITMADKFSSLPLHDIGQITFKNVDFNYPGNDEVVLSDFNLNIKRGETVALVGPSGAGKSTVLNLLMRFYDPTRGQILIENVNIKDLEMTVLRNTLGWVPQEPTIFKATVYENIRFSRPDASDGMVESAARSAYAIDFINKLPQGFDTVLGTEGVGLSSGQRQRLAIARAILKEPDILLLDEATNSLDSESEFQVQKAIDHLMKGRTTLIVAHRLSTVLNANRILVIDKGQIVATGSHTALLRQSPIYQRFVELQFDSGEKKNKIRQLSQ
jgi:ATP-binding cassette, subfamily B, bacterial